MGACELSVYDDNNEYIYMSKTAYYRPYSMGSPRLSRVGSYRKVRKALSEGFDDDDDDDDRGFTVIESFTERNVDYVQNINQRKYRMKEK